MTKTYLPLHCIAAALLLTAFGAPAWGAEPEPPETAGTLLVWHLPALVAADRPMELEVEVLGNGRVAFTEVARIGIRDVEGERAVELLASDPERRDHYLALAERGNVELEVRLSIDGRVVAQHPLASLAREGIAEGTRLLPLQYGAPAAPIGDDRQVFAVTAADCTQRAACLDSCRDDYMLCMETVCFPQIICEECENQHQLCQSSCPPPCCTEPKSVTYSTNVQMVSATWSGSGCYEGYFGGPGYNYDRYWVEYKFTKYKHTESCSGTVTTTVDSVWYESDYCWQSTWFQCPFPWFGTPYPMC